MLKTVSEFCPTCTVSIVYRTLMSTAVRILKVIDISVIFVCFGKVRWGINSLLIRDCTWSVESVSGQGGSYTMCVQFRIGSLADYITNIMYNDL